MLLVHLAGLLTAARWSAQDDPMSRAFVDYILYLIVVSAIYSVVFTPGELTTIMALSYYFARQRNVALIYRPAAVPAQPASPIPRHMALTSPRPSGRLSLRSPSGAASSG